MVSRLLWQQLSYNFLTDFLFSLLQRIWQQKHFDKSRVKRECKKRIKVWIEFLTFCLETDESVTTKTKCFRICSYLNRWEMSNENLFSRTFLQSFIIFRFQENMTALYSIDRQSFQEKLYVRKLWTYLRWQGGPKLLSLKL